MSKIFCIGVQKTGTTSIKQALRILGYTVSTSRVDLLPLIKSKKWDELLPVIDEFDALQDTPWYLIYEFLDKKFPGSKFIVTERSLDGWMKSVHNHFDTIENEGVLAMQEYIYGYSRPKQNEKAYKEVFTNHYKKLREYFDGRKEDILFLNIEDELAWENICEFLNKPIPNVSFPHANKSDYTPFKLKTKVHPLYKNVSTALKKLFRAK